jgi:hypothetical protein
MGEFVVLVVEGDEADVRVNVVVLVVARDRTGRRATDYEHGYGKRASSARVLLKMILPLRGLPPRRGATGRSIATTI